MRTRLFAIALSLAFAGSAHADRLDFSLYKLGNPGKDATANDRFRMMATELGAAISAYNLTPPETLGHSGFNFALEYAVSLVNQNGTAGGQRYWATEGDPAQELLMPTLHVRKGFPFSFETGFKLSNITYSRSVAATVEAKWALNEGFFFVPDLGVRGYGTRLINTKDFDLTVAGLDIGLGKQFPIGGMATLTPYVGWNLVWVNATSNVIDFNPARTDADFSKNPVDNTNVFAEVQMAQNHHNRFYGGLRFVSYVFELGAEASSSKLAGRDVTTIAAKLGLDF